MEHVADTFIPVIDGDVLHPGEKPFCYDPQCLCHENEGEIAILNYHVQEGHVTKDEATNIVTGKTV